MTSRHHLWSRRSFLRASSLATGAIGFGSHIRGSDPKPNTSLFSVADLPKGSDPLPVAIPHFPDRLHAFVWRNWTLVSIEKMALVLGAKRGDILRLGRGMGLPKPLPVTRQQERRSYITVIRRNWHLLPYEQLLTLLGWTAEEMAYTLREEDFLYIKLGSLKPKCEPLKFTSSDPLTLGKVETIARMMKEEFPEGGPTPKEPLFHFIKQLSSLSSSPSVPSNRATPALRFCYSYFALYGDPLLEPESDPYPDGYLAKLAQSGVNGVWLQGVLHKLAPFPWDETLSERCEERLENLRKLVHRARRYGIGIFLYLNEPRSLPLKFFANHPELKGVVAGDHATLCTSAIEVQNYVRQSITHICRAVPDLAGFFTITASENITNCWSHGGGLACPRCGKRSPAEVIAEVNQLVVEGIQKAKSRTRLLAWDWGWKDSWAEEAIRKLPKDVILMSVSEWGLPISRGGVKSEIGEYSISAIGPGPRSTRHWKIARDAGLKTQAKIQAGNTWELSAVPYIPAVENVARHAANLREAKVDGLMLGWTLGGYPSPNLEVVAEISGEPALSPEAAMNRVAERRFGQSLATLVVTSWKSYSAAFSEFPFHPGLVYSAPLQAGPANPLWEKATGYQASMVGLPYDHLDAWRAVYPAEVFIGQLQKVANGFASALSILKTSSLKLTLSRSQRIGLDKEMDVTEAAALHFRSVANQAQFVQDRNELAKKLDRQRPELLIARLEHTLRNEISLAKRLLEIQSRDSRIGFEATNHYFYVPVDLMEKVLNCRDLLDRWIPSLR